MKTERLSPLRIRFDRTPVIAGVLGRCCDRLDASCLGRGFLGSRRLGCRDLAALGAADLGCSDPAGLVGWP